MDFNSYIVQDTKISLSMPLACPPKKLKRSKDFKCFAFTLAETLITLTIIGVIAALTVPNLLNKYTKHTYVVGLKKAYAQLQHAMKMIPITEGCSAGDYDCAGMFQAGGYHSGGIWVSYVTNIDGQDFGGDTNKKAAYLLSKQFKFQKLCLEGDDADCSFVKKARNGYKTAGFVSEDGLQYIIFDGYQMIIDINGDKKPNKAGRDIFGFDIALYLQNEIQPGTVMPIGSKLYDGYYYRSGGSYWQNSNLCNADLIDLNLGMHGLDCTGRVLEEDAMNY